MQLRIVAMTDHRKELIRRGRNHLGSMDDNATASTALDVVLAGRRSVRSLGAHSKNRTDRSGRWGLLFPLVGVEPFDKFGLG